MRIEPLDAEVLEATELQYTERFMFLFFKRTRSKYFLRLNVRARVFSMNLENIEFKVEKDKTRI